jgi:hypothetical protein
MAASFFSRSAPFNDRISRMKLVCRVLGANRSRKTEEFRSAKNRAEAAKNIRRPLSLDPNFFLPPTVKHDPKGLLENLLLSNPKNRHFDPYESLNRKDSSST